MAALRRLHSGLRRHVITVEDGATLRKIEFWGENNVVSVPANLVIQQKNVGHGNQIIPRGAEWADPNNEFTYLKMIDDPRSRRLQRPVCATSPELHRCFTDLGVFRARGS